MKKHCSKSNYTYKLYEIYKNSLVNLYHNKIYDARHSNSAEHFLECVVQIQTTLHIASKFSILSDS